MEITSLSNNSIRPNFYGHPRQIQNGIRKILTDTGSQSLNLKLAEELKLGLPDIITPQKYIGEGTHNTVYKITRQYALRIPNNYKINVSELPQIMEFGKNVFSSLKSYFGEAILSLGPIQILRNVGHHRPAGVPEGIAKKFTKSKIEKYYLNTYLPRFVHIPQSSYDELAADINRLNRITLGPRRFCVFDSLNPNNIVLKRGKLYLVDEIDTLCDRSYSNTTAKLLEVFINRATKDMDAPQVPKKLPLVRKIFKKVVFASSKAGLVHANSKWDFMNWEKSLKLCKIKEKAENVLKTLENIEYKNTNSKEKDIAVKAYLDDLFIENPLSV